MTKRPDTVLFLDDHRGIYIPRDFANAIVPEALSGVSAEDLDVLKAGPDHEFYLETWDDVLNNAVVTENHEMQRFAPHTVTRYSLYQDGALWLIPEGMEWSDKEDGYVWPEDGDATD